MIRTFAWDVCHSIVRASELWSSTSWPLSVYQVIWSGECASQGKHMVFQSQSPELRANLPILCQVSRPWFTPIKRFCFPSTTHLDLHWFRLIFLNAKPWYVPSVATVNTRLNSISRLLACCMIFQFSWLLSVAVMSFSISFLESVHCALCAQYIGHYLINHYGDLQAFALIQWCVNQMSTSISMLTPPQIGESGCVSW